MTGPKQTIVTRRKERVLGIWTNMASRTFVNVPSYLAVLSTQPFEPVHRLRTRCGACRSASTTSCCRSRSAPTIGDVGARRSVPRQLHPAQDSSIALYVQKTNGVTLLTPTVFRAEIPLPAEAPFGNYDVDIKVFADGAMIARATSAFEMVKVGFEQFVATRRARLRPALRPGHRDDGDA